MILILSQTLNLHHVLYIPSWLILILLRLLVLRDNQYCAQQLSIPLSILFSKSFNSISLPLAWKEALVTPIYKKGDHTAISTSNYQPISLTSPIVRIMESIIRDQIQKHNIYMTIPTTCIHLINMVLVLWNPVLLSYPLQLTPGQNLLRRTM